ncbi:MAG: HK97 family phage prohead protease [Bifidobacterium tibiigranuli]|jgi:HK97 family phage prohead protease|uniref:HK97 family phage prohead protease n=1 Tax=Bifidobacterium tibiigranuli TaxID=2172043 RepID=UPI0026F2A6D7|nr:HK97 family phage prohead protease [Bifidobacterium tibiigranuli]MCI1673148.1 HK97 family phage prohead protease [Bifidobacterium tibiigranuli]MCI1713607.1 HK97 family phage prohead protease [Bifidobacterium tibiigranuli]
MDTENHRRTVTKTFTFKADTAAGEGKFTAVVNAFGVPDSQGQVMEPGAFAKSIETFTDDSPLPILWDHQWDDIWSHIGSAKATETNEGLQVEAQLDMNNPTAQQAYTLLSQHRVHEFSVGGFESPDDIETDDSGLEHVKNFDLNEVSLTLKGANPGTRLIGVKSEKSDDLSDSDITYLKAMIPHHQMAIDMSSKLLDDGDEHDPRVAKLAKGIIAAQQSEIDEMTGWLKDAGVKPSKMRSGDHSTLKEGRVLASKHVEALKSLHKHMSDGIKALDEVIDAVSPDPPDGKGREHKNESSESSEDFLMRKSNALAQLLAHIGQEENQ